VAPHLNGLEAWFDSPYPYPKLDILAVPEFAFGGMENPGLIVLADRMLVPEGQETPRKMRRINEVVAHELGHMWFGNLVTLAWWDDFWLNESFAEWIGNRMGQTVVDADGFTRARVNASQSALLSDGRATMRPVRTEVDPSHIFETTNFLAYPKGEALLSMVEAWLGPDTFQTGVRNYINANAWGNATSADLFAALGDASGKDVGAMMGPWLDRPGGPLVRLSVDNTTLTWSQSRFLAHGAEADADVQWQIPLSIRWADDGGVHTGVVLLDGDEGTHDLNAEGAVQWLLPTADGVGYLAWHLPDPQLEALLAAGHALSGPERQAIVGDLELLTKAGVYTGGHLLRLLEGFAEETDPRVMRSVMSAQSALGSVVEDDQEDAWGAYLVQTRSPWLTRIGLEAIEGEDAEIPALRTRLMDSLVKHADDEAVLAHLKTQASAFLADTNAVPIQLAGMALGATAMRSEPAFQQEMLDRWEAETEPHFKGIFLRAASLVPGDAQVERALAMAVEDKRPLREAITLSAGALATVDDRDFSLQWTIDNYDRIAEMLPPQRRASLVYRGAGCDAERWQKAVDFFGHESRATTGTERAIREGAESVALCLAQRELHGESIQAYLASRTADTEAPEE
jgi:alanyl aminopeptidase